MKWAHTMTVEAESESGGVPGWSVMANKFKDKGAEAERELAKLLTALTGWAVRRKLGAGRQDDEGDLEGIPDTTIQCKYYPSDVALGLRRGLEDLDRNLQNSGDRFGVCFLRRRGGDWIAVMRPEHWVELRKAAEGA